MPKLNLPLTVSFFGLEAIGKCSLKLIPVKDPQKSRIVVFEDTGNIMSTRNATPDMINSEVFHMVDHRTNAKFVVIKLNGKKFFISHAQIYEYSYEKDNMPEKALEQIRRFQKYKENKKEGIKPKWR